MYGTYETIDGKPAVRFERRYPHPVDRVWRAVTEPDQLAHWFPNAVEVDLREGGGMSSRSRQRDGAVQGRVTELDPPRRFSFLWGDSTCDRARARGRRLPHAFTHVLSTREQASRDAAGWHVCLDRLADLLSGDAGEAPAAGPRTSGARTTRPTRAAASRPAPRPGSA